MPPWCKSGNRARGRISGRDELEFHCAIARARSARAANKYHWIDRGEGKCGGRGGAGPEKGSGKEMGFELRVEGGGRGDRRLQDKGGFMTGGSSAAQDGRGWGGANVK